VRVRDTGIGIPADRLSVIFDLFGQANPENGLGQGGLGIGLARHPRSDAGDLQAAMERGITVAEVTYCNSISVSEHVVMMILALVRNYLPSHQSVVDGGWNIADCVARSYDLEGMNVGTVAAGCIGTAVLRAARSAIAMPSFVHSRVDSSQVMPVTCGSRSPRRPITRGEPCRSKR